MLEPLHGSRSLKLEMRSVFVVRGLRQRREDDGDEFGARVPLRDLGDRFRCGILRVASAIEPQHFDHRIAIDDLAISVDLSRDFLDGEVIFGRVKERRERFRKRATQARDRGIIHGANSEVWHRLVITDVAMNLTEQSITPTFGSA